MLSQNKHKADNSDVDDLPLKVRVRQMKVKERDPAKKKCSTLKFIIFLGFN